jgi:phosphoglycerate dehydrogenase-like enzyme
VEVLLRGWSLGGDPLDRLVGRAPKLRWIHSVSVGVESVLTPCVRLRGLTVTNGRGVFDQPIAEYVMTMILALCRRLPQLIELQRERTWQPLEAVELVPGDDRPGWALAASGARLPRWPARLGRGS